MIKTRFLLAVFGVIILSSCMIAPKYYNLNPDASYDAYWLKGKRFVGVQQDSIKIVAAFDRVERKKTIFYIQILNNSAETFDINPADFSCIYDIELDERGKEIKAIDPEIVIRRLSKEIEVKENRLQSRKQVDLLFEIWDSVGDLAADRIDKDEKLDRISDENRRVENQVSYISAKNEIKNLSNVKTSWDKEALRRTTLRKGDAISGLIYFPLNEDANEMTLQIPLNEKMLQLKYNQVKE